MDSLWDKDPEELVRQLESCLKLNEAYQDQYRQTKAKLAASPKGKQFDFSEMEIFGRFDLFCRRIIKLIDMFSTIDQFTALSRNRLEGMEGLVAHFATIVRDFRYKRHDLLAFGNNKFDRDYVEFNVKISDLEGGLQQFINASFENITSIDHSLALLHRYNYAVSTSMAVLYVHCCSSSVSRKLAYSICYSCN
jgi:dynein heavy chain, axonemal